MGAAKRKDYQDSEIMDALDATGYNLTKAAKRLGVKPEHFYRWVKESDNLRNYVRMRTESDASKARDKLNDILDSADAMDPRIMGNIISICKILLDKAEADKNTLEVTGLGVIDEELNDRIKQLLGE